MNLSIKGMLHSYGNYCVDEINRALAKASSNGAKINHIVSMDNKSDSIWFTVHGSQSVMRAKFKAFNLKACTEKHFSDSPTQYLQFISGSNFSLPTTSA